MHLNLSRLDRLRRAHPAPTRDVDLRDELVAFLPSLRAFAISLCGNPDVADDLVQDTVERAWRARDRFEPGTNVHAWLFTILRNAFLSRCRKAGREIDDPEGIHAGRIATPAAQEAWLDLADLRRALAELSVELREAILLVGAEGLSYQEAAEIMGCPLGTAKSRVCRARAHLAAILGVVPIEEVGPGTALCAA
ncbi:sigma-70 family RNA polymerase sigma factor [Salinarimonas soli]|uniref:Sigma-70 family RNA polymerase sigma factor n=1 Tax=Salinarimonas soli TaxID=1638099 RepID=A0A5B2V2D3_9HYPH|nr:sigma-70 family RNA polymerase sigma factor [Salinarimonas soli]